MEHQKEEQQQSSKFANAISILCFCVARFFTASYSNFSKILGDKGYSANDRIVLRYFGGGILSLSYVLATVIFEIAFRRKGRTVVQIWREVLGTKLLAVNVQRGLIQLVVTIGVIRSSDFLPVVILAAMDFVDRPVISAILSPLFREKVENLGLKTFTVLGSLVAAAYILTVAPRSELGAWGAGGFWELLAASALAVGALQVKTGFTWGDLAGISFRWTFRKEESLEVTSLLDAKKLAAKSESKTTSLFYQTLTGVGVVLVVWVLFSRVLPRFDMGDIVPLVGLMTSAFLLMLFDLAAKRGNVATLSLYSVTVPIFGLFWDTVREGHLPEQSSIVVAAILGFVAIVTTFGEYHLAKGKK